MVFTVGCNFRCPWCHNSDLALGRAESIPTDEVLGVLERHSGKLDAVVITGGEPLLWKGLPEFIGLIGRLGLSVKLDTNGSQPARLARLIEREQVEYLAMDIKGPLERYDEVTGTEVDVSEIKKSIEVIGSFRGVSEFRTTLIPTLTTQEVVQIAGLAQGADRYVLQPFTIPEEKELLDPQYTLLAEKHSAPDPGDLKEELGNFNFGLHTRAS